MRIRQISYKQALRELSTSIRLPGKPRFSDLPKSTNARPYNFSSQSVKLLQNESDYFFERAAIYEFDAGVARYEAERKAWCDILQFRVTQQIQVYESLHKFCNSCDDAALGYLTGGARKLKLNTIRLFKVFSLPRTAKEFLLDSFSMDQLQTAGLINSEKRFIFDRHRIVIPYLENARIVYIRARYFKDGGSRPPKGTPKYLSPCNHTGTLTSKRFFNLDALGQHTSLKLLITEGEFDCMIATQCQDLSIGIPGIGNFPTHLIHRLDPYEIYFAFDNDEAGQKAAREVAGNFTMKDVFSIRPINAKDITEAIE